MKKYLSVFLIIIFIFQLCCIASVFASAVGDDFNDTASWSTNIPDIYQNGNENYAHLKHTSAYKSFTQYKFTPPANDISGKFVVETRVKNPSASMSLMTVYLKNVSSASAVQIRSQYTGLPDGYSWRNLKVDKAVTRIKTDIIPEKPDFTRGWDTIYMVFDTTEGLVDVYFNGPYVKYQSEISTESGGLDYITFSVRKDIETEADAGMFIDYVNIYPYEDTFVPYDMDINENFIDEDFEKYDIGDNAFKGFIGYGPATLDYYAKVVSDPTNASNKCLKLENTTATTKNIAVDLGYENLHFAFKAYMPDNVYAQFPKFRTGSTEIVYGSTDTQGKYNLSGNGGSVNFIRDGWNDFEFDFDGTNATVKINNNEKIVIPAATQKIDCVLFSLWDNMAPIYIDDLFIYENNGEPVITASKKSGTVKYGSKIYLESNVDGAQIYYTLDGEEPDMASSYLYTEDGIEITDDDITIKAYGVNQNVSGRVFTFGKYNLESENGIILIPVDFNEKNSLVDATFSFINTQSEEKNVSVLLGMYDKEGMLIENDYEENLSLPKGKTPKTLSVTYRGDVNKDDVTIKAYIWSDIENATPLTDVAVYKNGEVSYEKAPSFIYDELPSMPIIESYKVNNEDKVITLKGSMTKAVKNQDIAFAVFDKQDSLIVLEQKYVSPDLSFEISSKFDSAKATGGALKAYVGSRANASGIYLDKGYYVDDLENKNLTTLLNDEQTSASLIKRMKDYAILNIITIDFANHTLYNQNILDCERIFFNSKNKNNFTSLSDAENVFEQSCVLANVINSADKKYYEEILENKEILDFVSNENYDLSLLTDFEKHNEIFDILLAKEDLSLIANSDIEKIYKTAYALCELNKAEKSKITDVLTTYNEEIFKLDMENDYKEVSAYEVAKALYNKDFQTVEALENAFDERVDYLIKNPPSTSNGGGSSSGGGSSNRVTVNVPTNITNVPVVEQNKAEIFGDVKNNHWAFNDINKLYNKKIISGYGNDMFMPEGSVTRAEFLKMVVASFELTRNGEDVLFKDVSNDEWFSDFINIAAQNGLVVGFDGSIRPYDNITRQEMAIIIVRALKVNNINSSETSFIDDDSISDYAKPAIDYLSKNKIVNGYTDNTFKPLKNLTRAETAKILCSVLGL